MTDDATLLHRYVASGDEAAFAEFVQRRIGFVYSAALRQLSGDDHLARDTAQLVFIDAARKARALSCHPLLSGWLYTATHHAAAKLVRGEQRRRFYERTAQTMNATLTEVAATPNWESLRPLLDVALRELGQVDRSAILLRFFENQSFSDVGRQLRLSEDAARKRVERALEKLRATLARRGVASPAAALAATLSTQAVHAAPTGLAQAVSVLAVKSAASTTFAASTLAFFAWPKVQVGLAAALIGVVGAGVAWEQSVISDLRAANARGEQLQQETAAASVVDQGRLASARAASASAQRSQVEGLAVPTDEDAYLMEAERKAYPNKWAAIVRRLHLQPDTMTALVKLDFERRHAGRLAVALARREGLSNEALGAHGAILERAIDAGFEERYDALLGKDQYAVLKEYQRTVAARNELGGFAQAAANAGVPVSDPQMDALATLLTNARSPIAVDASSSLPDNVQLAVAIAQARGSITPGIFYFGIADQSAPLPEEMLERAKAILTSAQFERLSAFQSARLALREIDARDRVAAARGALRLNHDSANFYPTASAPAQGAGQGQ